MEFSDCKWKEKVAAFRRNTSRFLVQIVGNVTLLMVNSEEILAVIPNEEAIHCHHLENIERLNEAFQYATNQKVLLQHPIGM